MKITGIASYHRNIIFKNMKIAKYAKYHTVVIQIDAHAQIIKLWHTKIGECDGLCYKNA